MPDRHVQGQHLFRRPFEVRSPLETGPDHSRRSAWIEARTLLDSFNTGHAGSLATIHANSAEKVLRRFANLVMRNYAPTTSSDTEAEIGEAVDFVVHVERQPGRRILREVLALRGYDRDAKRFLIEPVFEVQHAAA
jgi:pilus assembly protein CpaF